MKPTKELFGHKLRVRVSGLCFNNDSILLIKHDLDGKILWSPPGGGLTFGESVQEALIREFREETFLTVRPGEFLFFSEFIDLPLHALELFFRIDNYAGTLKKGVEPEISDNNIILDVGFFNQNQIKDIPEDNLHRILKICNNPIDLLDKRGQLK
jgi:8-oxo-dGTP diphosphatase